jgi:hypothetical protein
MMHEICVPERWGERAEIGKAEMLSQVWRGGFCEGGGKFRNFSKWQG